MLTMSSFLTATHLVGLALGMGSATVKLVLVLKCRADPAWVPVHLKVARLITRQIILGLVMLTLSGLGWLLLGYPFTTRLVVKLVLVAAILVLGPVIDNVVEPRFKKLAPVPGQPVSPAFLYAQKQYLMLEVVATLLFYVITVIWVLR